MIISVGRFGTMNYSETVYCTRPCLLIVRLWPIFFATFLQDPGTQLLLNMNFYFPKYHCMTRINPTVARSYRGALVGFPMVNYWSKDSWSSKIEQ